MRNHVLLLCTTLCVTSATVACGGAPSADEALYEPPPPTSGGHSPAPAADTDSEPTLEEKIRIAELSGTYQGVGDAPSPYEAQNQLAVGSEAYATTAEAKDVHLNGVELGEPDLDELKAVLGKRPDAGHYWYDARSGLWGLEGHGAGGVTRAGLRAPPLRRDASGEPGGDTTATVINGRGLTTTELNVMLELLQWPVGDYAGSYTLDADGKLHKVGGRYLGNLSTRANRARAEGKYNDASLVCALTQLGGEHGPLGKNVTINCD